MLATSTSFDLFNAVFNLRGSEITRLEITPNQPILIGTQHGGLFPIDTSALSELTDNGRLNEEQIATLTCAIGALLEEERSIKDALDGGNSFSTVFNITVAPADGGSYTPQKIGIRATFEPLEDGAVKITAVREPWKIYTQRHN